MKPTQEQIEAAARAMLKCDGQWDFDTTGQYSRHRLFAYAQAALTAAAEVEPNGLANLKAILDDQPFANSTLTVAAIRLILENKGGFMPDEAVMWFREWQTEPIKR